MRKRNRIPIIIGTLALSASVFAGGLVMTNAANSDDGCYEDKYYNAYQAYDRLEQNEKTIITQDTKCNQIWWVRQHHDAEENKLSQDPNKKNEGCVGYVLGWRVVISATDASNKSYSITCDIPDVELDEFKAVTEFTDANKSQHCEYDHHWYTLYALDLNTLYDYMHANDVANNTSTAEKINQCSNANITIYPIATYRAGIAEPAGSITYDETGITGTSGEVYYGDDETAWKKFDEFLMAKNGRSRDKFLNSGYFQRSYDGTINAQPGKCTYRFELEDENRTNLQKSELNFKPGWSVDDDGYLYHNNQLYKSYHELLKSDPLLDASEFSAGEDAANLRTGYTILDKWYVNGTENIAGDFGARNYGRNIKDTKGNTSSEVLTCKWKEHSYIIEFDSNGGNGFVPQIQTNYSTPEILNSGTGLYRDGYNFIGWSTNRSATEPDPGKEAGATVSKLVPSDGTSIKLYAVWQPGEYDITLKKEGGTGGTDSVVEKFGEFFGLRDGNGSLSKIDGIDTPVKVGHVFSGYFSGAMGTGDEIVNSNSNFTEKVHFGENNDLDTISYFTKNSNIYAYYIPKTPTITFDKQGGEMGSDTIVATYGEYMPAGLTAPVRQGWTFKGYYTEVNGKGTQYYTGNMGFTTDESGNPKQCDFENDITLYAYWVDETPADVDIIGNMAWSNCDVPVTILARDFGTGLQSITVYLDGENDVNIIKTVNSSSNTEGFTEGMTTRFTTEAVCSQEGIHNIIVKVTDMSGNASTNSTLVFIDKTAPKATRISVTDDGVTWNTDAEVTDYK